MNASQSRFSGIYHTLVHQTEGNLPGSSSCSFHPFLTFWIVLSYPYSPLVRNLSVFSLYLIRLLLFPWLFTKLTTAELNLLSRRWTRESLKIIIMVWLMKANKWCVVSGFLLFCVMCFSRTEVLLPVAPSDLAVPSHLCQPCISLAVLLAILFCTCMVLAFTVMQVSCRASLCFVCLCWTLNPKS